MERSPAEIKILEGYFSDLYALFMKRLSHFAIEPYVADGETEKIQGMLAELLKIKQFLKQKTRDRIWSEMIEHFR